MPRTSIPLKMNPMAIDLIIAPQSQFDAILQDVHNTLELDILPGVDVSIDEVVTIVAIHRKAIDDRPAWWKIRRELNARFAAHAVMTTRTLALIPNLFRDEIAALTSEDVSSVASRWHEREEATSKSLEQAKASLLALVQACQKATSRSSGVFLRTNQPPNAFEAAFSTLTGKSLANYRKVYDKLNDAQKYEAHQKYNYYQKQGLEDSLALVLRDFTRPGTKKINLKTDQRAIQRHILQCVKQYCKAPRPTLGNPDAPIALILLTFDIEYEGYVDFFFDTRENAISDLQLEERTQGCLEFCHWNEGDQRLGSTSYHLESHGTTEPK